MTSGDPQRAVRQWLEDWRAAGLTHLPKPAPRPVIAAAPTTSAASLQADASPADVEPVQSMPLESPAEISPPVPPARSSRPQAPAAKSQTNTREAREAALQKLARCVAGCVRCPELATTRTQTVFGVGNPQARVMFIGEAPGADEDATGEPFVGRAGQLLNKIIAACGWAREELYICNILRCRPPGNRTPSLEEAANCREWLDGQIAVVDPEYIVCWGTSAAQNLLGRTDAIGKLRGSFYPHGRAKVLCTYHPSYLLRNPEAKKPVWEDMQHLLKEMGLKPPASSGKPGAM